MRAVLRHRQKHRARDFPTRRVSAASSASRHHVMRISPITGSLTCLPMRAISPQKAANAIKVVANGGRCEECGVIPVGRVETGAGANGFEIGDLLLGLGHALLRARGFTTRRPARPRSGASPQSGCCRCEQRHLSTSAQVRCRPWRRRRKSRGSARLGWRPSREAR